MSDFVVARYGHGCPSQSKEDFHSNHEGRGCSCQEMQKTTYHPIPRKSCHVTLLQFLTYCANMYCRTWKNVPQGIDCSSPFIPGAQRCKQWAEYCFEQMAEAQSLLAKVILDLFYFLLGYSYLNKAADTRHF